MNAPMASRDSDSARIRVSAVLITKNAGPIFEATLAALSWCDEIVIVDSGSTDQTRELAERFGCRWIEQPFQGFGKQKQLAVRSAQHDWILAVDADEVVSPQLSARIRQLLASGEPPCAGYFIHIPLVFLGRRLRFGGNRRNRLLRLFDRRKGNYSDAIVHETVTVEGPVGYLPEPMMHYSYRNLDHFFEKFNEYSTKGAIQLQERGKRPNRLTSVLRIPIDFGLLYVVKGLVFDGFPGFCWAFLATYSKFVKRLKHWELATPEINRPAVSQALPPVGSSDVLSDE